MGPAELMVATAVQELPTGGGEWIYEPKFDGWRCRLDVVNRPGNRAGDGDGDGDRDALALWSRSGRRMDRYFPDLRRALSGALPPGSVLDGEVVVWDAAGKTDFTALQRRLTAGRGLPALAARHPAFYIAFDVLVDGDRDVRNLPLVERKAVLERLLAEAPDRLVRCPTTRDLTEARAWATTMAQLGIEGVVAKPAGGAYRPGRRRVGAGWVKYRWHDTTEAICGGVTGPRGHPETLLLGRFDAGGRLRLVGRTRPVSAAVAAELGGLLVSPAAGRQRAHHPWPQPLPAGWLGRWGRAEPLPYRPVDPSVVIEVRVDRAQDLAGRWRHPVEVVRPRLDLSVFEVPLVHDEP